MKEPTKTERFGTHYEAPPQTNNAPPAKKETQKTTDVACKGTTGRPSTKENVPLQSAHAEERETTNGIGCALRRVSLNSYSG